MNVAYYERLLETAGLIARHADYPGKRQVVQLCIEEVEELASSGQITADQEETIQGILAGVSLQTAR